MIYQGIAAAEGYASGIVHLKRDWELLIETGNHYDPRQELARLEQARQEARLQLEEIRRQAAIDLGEDHAAVFDAHLMFLEDPEYMGAVESKIRQERLSSMAALAEVSDQFGQMFASLEDEYMRERAADLEDVSRRLLRILSGEQPEEESHAEQTVLVARDLTPSDTAALDRSKVIAFVTDAGGRTSHTAIMARSMQIPAVVGLKNITARVKSGDHMLVDGNRGEVLVNPTPEQIRMFHEREQEYREEQEALRRLIHVRTRTLDGKDIEVAANISRPQDVDQAIANGADGIGLYRTEFLYMNRLDLPSEEEQVEAFRYVLERMEGKPVIIRTLDIGGDKAAHSLDLPREENPFLGYRAIRLCLDRPDLFKVQLRALLRASVYGNLKVMFPMISGIEEYRAAMALVEDCQAELDRENIPWSKTIAWGITVEIPSTAIMAKEIASEVDFLSIGTNDLTQYTLACDRMSEKVSGLYDPMHPAVLRLIQMTIEGGHAWGKSVGMCGEMAGDPEAIAFLVRLGLDQFSMAPGGILSAREIILQSEAGDPVDKY